MRFASAYVCAQEPRGPEPFITISVSLVHSRKWGDDLLLSVRQPMTSSMAKALTLKKTCLIMRVIYDTSSVKTTREVHWLDIVLKGKKWDTRQNTAAVASNTHSWCCASACFCRAGCPVHLSMVVTASFSQTTA